MEIGDIIKNARKKLKLTQVDLAAMLNVSQDTISSYEKGKIKVIPFEKRVKLAEMLDIPLDNLLYISEKISEKIHNIDEAYKKDIDVFINNNPIIAKDFLKSRYYLNLEKEYNKQGFSINKENANYEPSELLTALKFYGFMMQHIDMMVNETVYNTLLVEFFKVYCPAMADKLAAVFVDLETFKNEISEDAPIAFLDSEEAPVLYPVRESVDEETENN